MNDDTAIINQFLKGNQEAFATLVEKYANLIFIIAQRNGVQHNDCEDVVQETFIAAFRRLHQFQGREGATFKSWLCTIAYRQAVNQLRRQKGLVFNDPDSMEAVIAEAQDQGIDLDLDNADWKALVRRAVDQLPEILQDIVMDRANKISDSESAASRDIPLGTVRSRRAKAFPLLRQILMKDIQELRDNLNSKLIL